MVSIELVSCYLQDGGLGIPIPLPTTLKQTFLKVLVMAHFSVLLLFKTSVCMRYWSLGILQTTLI